VDPVAYVEQLHATVDQLVAPLVARHRERLSCGPGCASCCLDGLSVFEVEAALIRRRCAEVLAEEPHPPGACAFLDAEQRCRIYAQRPYVCRTQGLPLRWAEQEGEEVVEARDICPLNLEGEPLDELSPEDCWTLGPVERRLASAQERLGGDTRVALRALFS